MIFSRIIIFFLVFFITTETIAQKKLKFKPPRDFKKFKTNTALLPSKELTNPTPAVILLPSCDGIRSKSIGQYKTWTKFFAENGYVVLTVDHYKQRNAQGSGCTLDRKVTEVQLARDMYDAVEYLSGIENIDRNRIFSLGFSLGSLANALAASKKMNERIGKGKLRPRAVGSLYGGCKFGYVARFLFTDTDIPLIWLMASEDVEVPPEDCIETLQEIKKINKVKIVWHIYDGVTHCWDCRNRHMDSFTSHVHGKRVIYKYNPEATKDSQQRVLKFFNSFK